MIRPASVLLLALFLAAGPASADTVMAARTIRAQSIVTAGDLVVIEQDIPGSYILADEVIGQEARVVLYAGRPVMIDDVGPPALIERNQIVTLYYISGALVIAAEGRALGRAGIGDALRVMNLASRSTVTGFVRPDGTVSVGGPVIPSM